MSNIDSLPLEIVGLILSSLDTPPPSERHLFDKPSIRLFQSEIQPLKCISRTNRRYREAAAKLLFKHISINARRDLSVLFPILRDLDIGISQVHSILVHDDPLAYHPVGPDLTQEALCMAIELLNPNVVTVAISPKKMAAIMTSTCRLTDAWAFQILFQVLRLQTDKRISNVSQTPSYLMQARPWSQVTFNEGSSLPAYSTYEYFHLQVPSWMVSSDPTTDYQWPSPGCLQFLTVFEYIAVFPIANMDCLNIVASMSGLRILRVQLAPSVKHPSANQNDITEAKSMQDNHKDMWMEFYGCITDIADRIENDWPSLPLSTVDFLDYRNDALKAGIEEEVEDHMISWTRHGECSWIRNTNNSNSSTGSTTRIE